VQHALTQNTRGLPWTSSDTGALSDSYAYDQNGNVASITDNYGAVNRTMGYDTLDRLTSVAAPALWGTSSYTYDALDNLTFNSVTAGANARSVTFYSDPATNRLMSASGSAGYNFNYTYDTQGNIVQRGTQQFVFDQANRLTSAPGVATYAYDGFGRRFSVVGNDGVNRVQLYTQDGKILQAGPVGGAATKYIYLHNHVIAEVGPAGIQYQHTDALGSPVARTNPAGAGVSTTKYEPYGKAAQGATPTIGFTRHVNDADTGLVYTQQRYHDPVAGRFLSIDPVVTDANSGSSFNRYAYANNNPYRYIDPDGREGQLTIGSSILVGFQIPGVFGGMGGFLGGGLSVGITSNAQIIVQANYTLSQGVGALASVGAQVAVGGTKDPTPVGVSTSKTIQFDANAGLGTTAGGSVQVPLVTTGQEGDISAGKGVGGPKVGVGAGAQVSAGINTTTTIATPPLIKVPEIIKKDLWRLKDILVSPNFCV
jgi:RHS repeat-associated protein